MSADKLERFRKLERDQKTYGAACIVLGEILQEHRELTGCIRTIGTYIAEKMEANEKELLSIYGEHGEGLTVAKVK